MTSGNTIIEYIENSNGQIMEAFLESKGIESGMISETGLERLEESEEFMNFATLMHSEGF